MKILTAIVLAIVLILAIFLLHTISSHLIIVIPEGMQPIDLATISMVAATLVVTGVAIGIAILALWGFGNIRRASLAAATKEAGEVAEKKAAEIAGIMAESAVARELPGAVAFYMKSSLAMSDSDVNAMVQAIGTDGDNAR